LSIYFQKYSHLSGRVLGHVFIGRWWEQIWGEFGGSSHVSLDFHFALHESNLRVQSAFAYFIEISINHVESSIWIFRDSLVDTTLAVFQIDFVDESWLRTLFLGDFKTENSLYFFDGTCAFPSFQIDIHHVEDVL
jgi:hypothetical protein